MVIDIILIVLICLALFYGLRKGAIVLVLQLVAIYAATLVAADHADKVGSIFTDDPGLSYLLGYVLLILGVWLFIWIIAPLLRKILFFDALKRFDSLIGMLFSVASAVVGVAV